MQGLCSSTAGVGVHAAGSERKQWLREDPCGAAQLDNRSVRGGTSGFLPACLVPLVSYIPLGRRVFSLTLVTPQSTPYDTAATGPEIRSCFN